MAHSALHRFPAEIVEAIVEDVPKADLPSARFLGKKFSEIAAPKLFSAIPLWISIKSLKTLADLASHTQLRGYVKEIVFSPLRFVEQEDESAYFAGVKEALEYEFESASITSLRYGQHQASYHGYIKAQKYLEKDDLDVKIMSRAFRQFPALSIATVCNGHPASGLPYIGSKEIRNAFDTFQAGELVSSTGVHTLPAFIKGLAAAGVKISNLNIGQSPNLAYSKQKCLSSSTYPTSLQSSKASYPPDITAQALEEAFLALDNPSHSYIRLVNGLRVFKIDKMEEEGFDNVKKFGDTIARIISKAPQLEMVSIERLSSRRNRPYPRFTDLFAIPRTPLHPLEELTLQHMEATADRSVAFFKSYAGTLATVKFDGMHCEDERWFRILERLRDLTFPRLRQFRLRRCSSSDDIFSRQISTQDINVTDYLLHKTDENPHLDA